MKTLIKACFYLFNIGLIATAQASLLETSTHNNIVYFADNSSTALKRYSLQDEKFLTPIILEQNPDSLHVDPTGIYISYGTRIVKLDLTGTHATQIKTTNQTILDIEATNQYLLLSGYNFIEVLNKTTNALISSSGLWYTAPDISLSRDQQQMFSLNLNSSGGIHQTPILSDGSLGLRKEHASYQFASHITAFPTQNYLVDNYGTVYNAIDLSFAGNLGSFFTDINFWQGLPIVLRESTLYSYNKAMTETGSFTLPSGVTAEKIAIYLNKVFTFSFDESGGNHATSFDIALLSPANPTTAINPSDLSYTPDDLVLDKNHDTIYLLSRNNLNIFRWSITQSAYLASIPLTNAPLDMSYSGEQERIYLTYGNGDISYIDLTDNKEYPFTKINGYSSAIAAAGQYLVVHNMQGGINVYDKAGTSIDEHSWAAPTSDIVWDSTYQQIYYISQYSPADLHQLPLNTASGLLGTDQDTPYHDGDYLNWIGPIRISASGKFIALGSGRVFAENTLTQLADLETLSYFKDVAWLYGKLYTLKSIDSDGHSQLQSWSPDLTLNSADTYKVDGSPIGLLTSPSSGKLILIYSKSGKPQFEVFTHKAEDFDKDGYLDDQDVFPNIATEWLDFDGDDLGNNADPDDDNDGVLDVDDAFPLNKSEALDTDKDGTGNNTDTDDDNDGAFDDKDIFPLNAKEFADLDGDGIGNNSDSDIDGDDYLNSIDDFPLNPLDWLDTDKDGTGNNADSDDDSDGVLDYQDALPLNATESKDMDHDAIGDNTDPDIDGDNIRNSDDAFPLDKSDWLDTDKDGTGNNADSDDDNDGVLDYQDVLPLDATESTDMDYDGIGDNTDLDIDGDFVLNISDAFPLNNLEWLDTDKDGKGDYTDSDDDNDGVADTADFYPNDAARSALKASDYLPLNPGNSWLYDSSDKPATLAKTITIAGESITPIQLPNGGKLYLKVVGNKIQLFGFYLPDYDGYKTDFTLKQGIDLLQSADYLKGIGNVNISPTYGNRSLNWNASVEYLGPENILVPAQRYAAIHSRLYFLGATVIDGETVYLEYSLDLWFAENVGIVRINENGSASDLVSATIAQPTTGNNPAPSASAKSGGGKSDWSFIAILLLLSLGHSRQQQKKATQ